jgi:hypothetical protein
MDNNSSTIIINYYQGHCWLRVIYVCLCVVCAVSNPKALSPGGSVCHSYLMVPKQIAPQLAIDFIQFLP